MKAILLLLFLAILLTGCQFQISGKNKERVVIGDDSCLFFNYESYCKKKQLPYKDLTPRFDIIQSIPIRETSKFPNTLLIRKALKFEYDLKFYNYSLDWSEDSVFESDLIEINNHKFNVDSLFVHSESLSKNLRLEPLAIYELSLGTKKYLAIFLYYQHSTSTSIPTSFIAIFDLSGKKIEATGLQSFDVVQPFIFLDYDNDSNLDAICLNSLSNWNYMLSIYSIIGNKAIQHKTYQVLVHQRSNTEYCVDKKLSKWWY